MPAPGILELLDPCLETISRLADRVHARQELLHLEFRGDVTPLLGQVLGDVLREGIAGLEPEFHGAVCQARKVMRERVTRYARQLLLEIRLRRGEQLLETLRDFGVARDLQPAALECLGRVRRGEPCERERRSFDRGVGRSCGSDGESGPILS